MTMAHSMRAMDFDRDERGVACSTRSAPLRTYATADGKYMAVGRSSPFLHAASPGLELESGDTPRKERIAEWPPHEDRSPRSSSARPAPMVRHFRRDRTPLLRPSEHRRSEEPNLALSRGIFREGRRIRSSSPRAALQTQQTRSSQADRTRQRKPPRRCSNELGLSGDGIATCAGAGPWLELPAGGAAPGSHRQHNTKSQYLPSCHLPVAPPRKPASRCRMQLARTPSLD